MAKKLIDAPVICWVEVTSEDGSTKAYWLTQKEVLSAYGRSLFGPNARTFQTHSVLSAKAIRAYYCLGEDEGVIRTTYHRDVPVPPELAAQISSWNRFIENWGILWHSDIYPWFDQHAMVKNGHGKWKMEAARKLMVQRPSCPHMYESICKHLPPTMQRKWVNVIDIPNARKDRLVLLIYAGPAAWAVAAWEELMRRDNCNRYLRYLMILGDPYDKRAAQALMSRQLTDEDRLSMRTFAPEQFRSMV